MGQSLRLLIVDWLDAGIAPGWIGKRKRPTYTMQTVGWEIDRNKDYLFIAGTIEQKGNGHGDLSSIPIGCITKEVILEGEDQRKRVHTPVPNPGNSGPSPEDRFRRAEGTGTPESDRKT